jgi:hypothetical protein
MGVFGGPRVNDTDSFYDFVRKVNNDDSKGSGELIKRNLSEYSDFINGLNLDEVKTLQIGNFYKSGLLYSLKGDDFTFERTSTATRFNKDGLIEEVDANVPRLDYSTGEAKILIESQSTNLYNNNNTNDLSGKFGGGQFINKEIIPNAKGDIFGYKAELVNPSTFLSAGMNFAGFNLSTLDSYSCSFILRVEPNETKKFFGINVSGGNAGFFIDLETLNYEIVSFIFNESVIKLNDTDYLISFASTGDNFSQFSQFRMAFIEDIVSANPTPLEGVYTIIGFGIYDNTLGRQSIIKTNGTIKTRVADNAYINNFTPKYSNRILNNKLSINNFNDFILPQQSTKYGLSFDELIGVNTFYNFNINEVEYYDVDVDNRNFREGLKDDTVLSLFPSENNTTGQVRTLKGVDLNFQRNSTATRVNSDGLIEEVGNNIPRIDYSTGDGAILIEPQRTNLIEYSEDFTTVNWSAVSWGRITQEGDIDPFGNTNSTKFYLSEGKTDVPQIRYVKNYNSNTTYTFSIFLKAKEKTNAIMLFGGIPWGSSSGFGIDLISGTLSSVPNDYTANIINVGNGWFRVSVTSTTISSGSGTAIVRIPNYTGNGGDGILVYGGQIEEGSYATSYIPTSGTTITRVRDIIPVKDFDTSIVDNNSFSVIMNYELLNPGANDIYGRGESLIFAMFKQGLSAFQNQFAIFKRGDNVGIRVRNQGANYDTFSSSSLNIQANIKYKLIMNYIPGDRLHLIQNGEIWEFIDENLPPFVLDRGFFQAYDNSSQAQRIYNLTLNNSVIDSTEAINLTSM